MNKFYSKAFLNESIKIDKVFAAIHTRKVDISFFQEVNPDFISKVNKEIFFVASSEES